MSRGVVLVIENQPEHRELATLLLTDAGYEVENAATGKEGLQLARMLRPQIILLALNLPDIDGFETLRQLKEDPATCNIPVIAVSPRNSEEDRVRGLEAGFLDYVIKP
ncbi:MAG TPA: response regulator, partial [Armatimonadetes bacterium]|nr:response regulator [Armatimonadota bacterium]